MTLYWASAGSDTENWQRLFEESLGEKGFSQFNITLYTKYDHAVTAHHTNKDKYQIIQVELDRNVGSKNVQSISGIPAWTIKSAKSIDKNERHFIMDQVHKVKASKIEHDIKIQSDKLSEALKENQALQLKLDTINDSHKEELEKAKTDIKSKVSQIKADLETLTKTKAELELEVQKLKEENSSVKQDLSSTAEKLEKSNQELNDYQLAVESHVQEQMKGYTEELVKGIYKLPTKRPVPKQDNIVPLTTASAQNEVKSAKPAFTLPFALPKVPARRAIETVVTIGSGLAFWALGGAEPVSNFMSLQTIASDAVLNVALPFVASGLGFIGTKAVEMGVDHFQRAKAPIQGVSSQAANTQASSSQVDKLTKVLADKPTVLPVPVEPVVQKQFTPFSISKGTGIGKVAQQPKPTIASKTPGELPRKEKVSLGQ